MHEQSSLLVHFRGSIADAPCGLRSASSDWDVWGLFLDLSTVVNGWYGLIVTTWLRLICMELAYLLL